MKNVMIGSDFSANSRNVSSRFPHTMPIINGINVAINASTGIDAIPAVPIAIIVKKGPSFNDKMEIAPASLSSPYCCASPKYNPPAEFVIAAIIAIGVTPNTPAFPHSFATINPNETPNINFISVNTNPL